MGLKDLKKLRALKSKVDDTLIKNHKAREQREAKRAKRESKKLDPRPNYRKAPRKKNSVDVETWFRDGIERAMRRQVVLSPWTLQQKKLAKDLIGIYGEELTEQAVEYMCRNWKNLKKGFKSPPPVPTINLLWGMRDNIFSAVQFGDKSPDQKDSDEYKGDQGGGAIGW